MTAARGKYLKTELNTHLYIRLAAHKTTSGKMDTDAEPAALCSSAFLGLFLRGGSTVHHNRSFNTFPLVPRSLCWPATCGHAQ